MNLLVHNGTILTMHNRKVIRQGAVVTEGENVVAIGKADELRRK